MTTPPLRMHARLVAAVSVVTLLAAVVVACSPDGDAPAGVTVELQASSDQAPPGTVPRLALTVHNGSDAPCSVPKHGIGSAIVTSVTRDRTDLASSSRPIPTEAPSIDAVRAALTALPPGQSLALDVQTSSDPPAIETHRIENDGTLLRTTWPIAEQGEYRITAALATPVAVARPELPPLCTPTQPSTAMFTVR